MSYAIQTYRYYAHIRREINEIDVKLCLTHYPAWYSSISIELKIYLMKPYGSPYEHLSVRNGQKVLILGVGNQKKTDQGVGLHVIDELEKNPWPKSISLLKGDFMEIDFASQLSEYENLILIDTAKDTFDPGTIFIHRPDFTLDFSSMSFSQLSKKDQMDYFIKQKPSIFLFTVTPQDINSSSTELSFPIKQVIPRVIDEVTTLASRLIVS